MRLPLETGRFAIFDSRSIIPMYVIGIKFKLKYFLVWRIHDELI